MADRDIFFRVHFVCIKMFFVKYFSTKYSTKIHIKEPPNPIKTRLDGSNVEVCWVYRFVGETGSSPTAGMVKTSIFSGVFLFLCAFRVHYIANFFSKWLFSFLVNAASYSLITPR